MTTLTEKRRSLDMSLGECARAAGLPTQDLSKIERGSTIPTDEICLRIGRVLGMSIDEVKAGLPDPAEAQKNFERASDMLLALAAVAEDAKKHGLKRGSGGRGEIVCPICRSTLCYSVAGVNGHIWGACTNPDCVRWMQ